MRSNSHLRVQVASILEILAKAAVAEICELVDNGYAKLHLEISRSNSENEVLTRKLQMMEQKLSHYSERLRARESDVKPDPDVISVCDSRRNKLSLDSEQVSDWCSRQCRDIPVDEELNPTLFTRGDGCVELQKCMLRFADIKGEMLEESTSQREVDDVHEDSGACVADPNLDEDSEMTPKSGQEIFSPILDHETESEINNTDPRLQDAGPHYIGLASMDYEHETKQQLTWSRECVTETHLTQHTQYTQLSKLSTPQRDSPRSPRSSLPQSQSCHTPRSSGQSLPESTSDFSTFFHFEKHLTIPAKVLTIKKSGKSSHCGKGFSSQSHMDLHTRTHTGVKPLMCTQCGKSFTHNSNLKQHQRFVHKGEKPHHCSQCGKGFTLPANLKIHQNIHTGARPYVCSLCSKTFADPSHLRRHKVIHTGVRPHCCSHCGRTFTQTGHLKYHLKHVHFIINT